MKRFILSEVNFHLIENVLHNDKWHLHKTPQVTFISIATISIAPTPLKKKKCSNYNMIQTRINWKLLPFTNITTHTKFIGT